MQRLAVFVVLGVLLVGAVAGGLSAEPPGSFGYLYRDQVWVYIAWAALAGALYAVGIWLVRGRPAPAGAVAVILVAGLLARLIVLQAPPVLSTDLYRYVWDGQVQAAGINPYRYLPADPALGFLRDTGTGPASIYRNINRVDSAPTIYPPVAQVLFALVGATAPSIWTIKGAMLAFDLLTTGLALLLLRAAALPTAQVLIWAWNPLVIWEFAGSGHIDAMALAFTALALLAAARSRAGWAGLALGAAVMTKLLPAALFPAIWRRWSLREPLAALALLLGGYAAYAGAGWRVFGYLGGYTQEEQLRDGGGFLLLRLLRLAGPLPAWAGAAYAALGLAVLGGVALRVVWRPLPVAVPARAAAIGRGALMLTAALIAVLSPHYPWYLTMLVLPAVLVPAWSAVWPTIAGPLLYLDFARSEVLWPALVFLPSVALLLLDTRLQRPALATALLAKGGP